MAGEDAKQKIKYTKYELARMIGARALQISTGAPFLIDVGEEKLKEIGYNPIEIAKLELEAGALPLEIKRPLSKPKQVEENA